MDGSMCGNLPATTEMFKWEAASVGNATVFIFTNGVEACGCRSK